MTGNKELFFLWTVLIGTVILSVAIGWLAYREGHLGIYLTGFCLACSVGILRNVLEGGLYK